MSEIEGLEEDIKEVYAEINKARIAALEQVAADMKNVLLKHIKEDVLKKYKPRKKESSYVRREKGGIDDLEDERIYSFVNGQNLLMIDYEPKGDYPGRPDWSNVTDNEFVRRLETKNPPYEWGNNIVPERPFWQNFVDETIRDEQTALDFFVNAMKMQGMEIELEGNDLISDHRDGDY